MPSLAETAPVQRFDEDRLARHLWAAVGMLSAVVASMVLSPRAESAPAVSDKEAAQVAYDCRGLDPVIDRPFPLPGLGGDPEPRPTALWGATIGTRGYCPPTSGKVAFVLVSGAGPEGSLDPTLSQVVAIEKLVEDELRVASGGRVDLEPYVIQAPKTVTEEVRTHLVNPTVPKDGPAPSNGDAEDQAAQLGGGDGDCIDSGGKYTPAQVARRQMAETLKEYRMVIAIGGMSCKFSYYDNGKLVQDRAAGTAERGSRGISIYPNGGADLKDNMVALLVRTIVHEQGHQLGLGHINTTNCPEDNENSREGLLPRSQYLDVNQLIITRLREACGYTEYSNRSPQYLAMINNQPLPADSGTGLAPELFTALQVDHMTHSQLGDGALTLVAGNSTRPPILADRYAGQNVPYGLLIPLKQSILYTIPGTKDATSTYTGVYYDYRVGVSGLGELGIYLTSNTADPMFGMLYLGKVVIPEDASIVNQVENTAYEFRDDPGHVTIKQTPVSTEVA